MKKIILSLILAVVFVGALAVPVFAIDQPTSTTLESIRVYQNLYETGDVAVVFHWDWAYASDNFSSTPASISMMYRFYDTDGTTLLSTDTPYVFSLLETNGHGNNVGAFYFSASDNLTWGAAYHLNIQGLPSYFDPAVPFTYVLTTDDYTTKTLQEDTREELYDYIMTLCDTFNGLYDIDLKTSSDSGIVLSSYGELFFRGAIPGLQILCPQLFFIQQYVPEQMSVQAYDLSLGTTYTGRLAGTEIETGFTRIGAAFGASKSVAMGFIFLIVCGLLCFFTIRKGWGIEIGLAGSAIVGIFAAIVVGDIWFTLIMIASLVAIMGLAYIFVFKRA